MEIIKGNKKMWVTIMAVFMIVTTVLITLPTIVGYANSVNMGLKGKYKGEDEAIHLEWNTPNQSEPYNYQVYSKKPNEEEFQSISATNLDLDKVVKALNVFPVNHVGTNGSNYIPVKGTDEVDLAGKPLYRSAMLKEWIGDFGHGKIEVDAINQNDFDENPEKYLMDADGNYKYDVVAVGFWNINQGQNHSLEDNGVRALREFVESGRGILTGHHHIGIRELDKGMNLLKDLFGVKFIAEDGWNQRRDTYYHSPVEMDYTHPEKSTTPHNSRFWATGDEVVASKRGLLLEYPNYVAQEGRVFNIPLTHNAGDYVTGDVWLEFTNPMSYRPGVLHDNPAQLPDGTKGSANSYLSTFNNTALIQTGHSSLTGGHLYSTEDEKMLVANTIFYLAQLTQETSLVDRSAMDIYPPHFVTDAVNVDRTDSNIKIDYPDAKDPTNNFEYYVRATGQDTKNELTSETITVPQTTGVEGYSYVMDNNPDTKPNSVINTKSRTVNIPNNRNQKKYFHVSAVDGVGNVSEPLHVDLSETYYQVDGNLFMDLNGNGIRNTGEPYIERHTVSLVDSEGLQLYDLDDKPYQAVTDSEGYYRFDVYTGGQIRLKVEPLEDRRFTAIPEDGYGSGDVYNQITDAENGLTDIFTVNDKVTNVTINAGFTFQDLDYRVEHINEDTGNKIAVDRENHLDGITTLNTEIRPLRGEQLPRGYEYTGSYSINDGAKKTGTVYNLDYEDYTGEVVIKMYYGFNQVSNTTKRFQGDDLDSPIPLDSYTNAGIYTNRDSNGGIIESGMSVNSTFILDEFEAPIAIIPTNINMKVLAEDGHVLHEVNKDTGNRTILLNQGYLDSIRVTSVIGSSGTERVRIGNFSPSTYTRLNMDGYGMKGTEEVRRIGSESTNATIGTNEDSHYVGRWVNETINISTWTPNGLGGIGTTFTGEDLINRSNVIQTGYDLEIYNILRHNYVPRLDSEGVEYYEYQDSTLQQGYYPYNSSGTRINTVRGRNTEFRQTSRVSVNDIHTGSYINADGFSLEDGKVTPIQQQVAVEVIDGGGQAMSGHETDTITDGGISEVSGGESVTNMDTYGDRTIINYYEELTYIPYSTEEDLITQQAIPVGGKIFYNNPYEYSLLPSYRQPTVNERSGETTTGIRNNVTSYNNTGELGSEIDYTKEHTGLYVSEVDSYDSFETSIPKASISNLTYMERELEVVNEHNPYKSIQTGSYNRYINTANSSVYLPVGGVQATTDLEYRLPLEYVPATDEVLLENVVAVGQDTGFPIYGSYNTLSDEYKANYQSDIGNNPSETDKLITSNKGSIYLIPLNNQGLTLDSEYRVREFINKIGMSQTSVVNDKTYTAEKYLYGRGNNVIYSGQRDDLKGEREFISDQTIKQGDTGTTTIKVNGIRTGNNSEINESIEEEEE